MSYWRTHSGQEVDLILGEMDVAIEFKSSLTVGNNELKGMRSMLEEFKARRSMVVSRDSQPRVTADKLEILPWELFCQMLWAGEIVKLK